MLFGAYPQLAGERVIVIGTKENNRMVLWGVEMIQLSKTVIIFNAKLIQLGKREIRHIDTF